MVYTAYVGVGTIMSEKRFCCDGCGKPYSPSLEMLEEFKAKLASLAFIENIGDAPRVNFSDAVEQFAAIFGPPKRREDTRGHV